MNRKHQNQDLTSVSLGTGPTDSEEAHLDDLRLLISLNLS